MSVPLSGYRDYAALAAYADDCAERAFSAAVQESYRRLAKSYRALARQRARMAWNRMMVIAGTPRSL
jgi:hypothetical protein